MISTTGGMGLITTEFLCTIFSDEWLLSFYLSFSLVKSFMLNTTLENFPFDSFKSRLLSASEAVSIMIMGMQNTIRGLSCVGEKPGDDRIIILLDVEV